MIDRFPIPEHTIVTANGEGPAIDLEQSERRLFLVLLTIDRIVEQESVEVNLIGSADGMTWKAKPVLTFPQKFYRGEYPLLLDLSHSSEVRFVRARWSVNRWGRGPQTPMFEVSLRLREVDAAALAQAKGTPRA